MLVYQRVLLFWPQFMALCFYFKDDKEDDKENYDDKMKMNMKKMMINK